MTQALKNNWPLISWRLSAIAVIALLHNWAMASLLAPPTLSAPAGQKGQFSVAVQFSRPAPTPSQQPKTTTDKQPDTPKEPKPVAQNKPKPQPKAPSKPTPTATTSQLVEQHQEKTETKQPVDEIAKAMPEDTEPDSAEPEQAAQASSQAANGAHREAVITEPLFASPPTPPRYPTIARKRGQEGTVWLDVWLDAQGNQSKLAIAQSSGLSVLDESALKAVRQWEFQAYQVGGIHMASRVRIPVEFSLN